MGFRMNANDCLHTGLAKPECSCSSCLQEQMMQHMPKHLQAKLLAAPAATPQAQQPRAA
jgi:hypothetical protein